MAGEELSSVGSRFPRRSPDSCISMPATDFALYDPAHPLLEVEMNDIKRRIDEIEAGGVDEQKKLLELESAAARFESALHETMRGSRTCRRCRPVRRLPLRSISACRNTQVFLFPLWRSMLARTTGIACRIVRENSSLRRRQSRCTEWAESFRRGVPSARIVVILTLITTCTLAMKLRWYGQ